MASRLTSPPDDPPRDPAPEASAEARRRRILGWLGETGSVRVRDLAARLGVSESTTRNDLRRLEGEGLIRREHGGAFVGHGSLAGPRPLVAAEIGDAMLALGRAAATLVGNGETIVLDAGTAMEAIAVALAGHTGLTVITSSLAVALRLGTVPGNIVYLTGGQYSAEGQSLSGDSSRDFFRGLHVTRAFLAGGCLSPAAGLTYSSFAGLALRDAMIRAADSVAVVAASTRINRTSFAQLCRLDAIDLLVTDDAIAAADVRVFEAAGVRIVVADRSLPPDARAAKRRV